MSHVFISYKTDDVDPDFLNELWGELTQANIKLWQDKRSIPTGAKWAGEIDTALRNAYVILVLVSEHAINSPQMTYEWAYGMGYGKKVLPLVLDGGNKNIHPKLSEIEWIPFEGKRRPWGKLIQEINLAKAEDERLREPLDKIIGKALYEEWKNLIKHSKHEVTAADFLRVVVTRQKLITTQDYAELLQLLLDHST